MNRSKLNWLRAGVLGANDGIISVSVVLISVIGILDFHKLLLVGISAIIAGALSMSIGEYVSVSAQKDAEEAWKQKELTNPVHAALSSFLSFLVGAVIPFGAALLFSNSIAIIIAVILTLVLTTSISMGVSKVRSWKPFLRNIVSGALALGIGIVINTLFAV